MLSRIPIRVRLTLAFALAAAIALVALGAILYARVGSELDESLNRSLRARADDVVALVSGGAQGTGPGLAPADNDPRNVTQVIDAAGEVVDGSAVLKGASLLTQTEVARARRGEIVLNRPRVTWSDEHIRLLAAPARTPSGATYVVAVGSTLEAKGDALESLLAQLLLLGPIALVLVSAAAYVLAGAALRPVEAMRREAEAVSDTELGRRLPVPAAADEIARLGETLNAMLARLEGGIERERRFVADAGHELRTPLATLRTELELALRRERTPEELRAALVSAAEETDRLATLADELLVLARSGAGDVGLTRRPVTLAAVLERVRERAEDRLAAERRPLVLDCDSTHTVAADFDQLVRAVGNLVDNALLYGAGEVRVEVRGVGDRVEIHVLDDGPGFADGFSAKAFEPFARADPARSDGGAGLGLAIVAAIARAHGGEAHARPGPGGDVRISLPVSPPPPEVSPAATTTAARPLAQPDG